MFRLNILGFKGYYALSTISDSYLSLIDDVVIAEDKKIQKDFFEESSALCISKGIKYFKKNTEPECKSNYLILIGWRWMVSEKVKLIIFHDSLLPKYRGFC